ncbi:hypothetical protein B0H66DRAFT_182449 [Apodospora peruviana]|uniref:J domain-containing protein n=1 Tax=Apodospora peruviana TaxID=516989 RepID=A0AAE0IB48_9PEZI|nr:hypothetical protein B0H66DRAFT_182449 [Apodospora peruviana]
MLHKKPTAAVCYGLSNLSSSWPITSSTWPRRHTTQSPLRGRRPDCSIRNYASVQHGKPEDHERSHAEPQWPATPNPTPYEIFGQAKTAPYNKLRFYQLVKLYHPDRHHHTAHDGISHLIKLDRYRLVVTANDILSDPERRRLYDLHGAGWGSQPDMRNGYRAADRTWRREPGNASANATWEDWERWYQEQDGTKQRPVFMSNGMFASLVTLFVVVGVSAEVTRAGKRSAEILEMRDRTHSAIGREMRRRESQTIALNKGERVEHFLKSREAWRDARLSRRGLSHQEEPK